MADLTIFKKLSQEEQLESVKNFISSFPKEKQAEMVRDLLVDKADQDKMIKDLGV